LAQNVVVIGAGPGGLAAAMLLARSGLRVTVLERLDHVGGRSSTLRAGDFQFDSGATFFLYPQILNGRTTAQALDLVRLDPQWRCFFADGSTLDLVEDVPSMADRLDRYAPAARAGEGYPDFMALSKRLHEVSEQFFFWKAVEGIGDTLDLRAGFDPSTIADVLSLRFGASVAGTIRRRVRDRRVAQMLDHFTQYVGSSPYGSPAVLCAIAHTQTSEGVWYPRGGTGTVPQALARLARDSGVELRLGTGVRRIVVREGRVAAVETAAGDAIGVDAVVSNMDAVRTMTELVGGAPARRFIRRRKYEPACSGVVFYLGLDRAYPHLLHHDFVFSADPQEEFDWIYRRGEPAPDPTCYIAAPARTDPAVAPAGGEALYVLVHTPYLRPHHDWAALLPGYRRIVFDKLARTAGLRDLDARIRCERVLTPADIHRRYAVLDGAIYGLASHGRLLGAFKPGNRSRDVLGLYLAGGAAHPGPGMPMVLMSGWIAADALDTDAACGRLSDAA
jgi:diapolycopene oxygenase